MTRLTVLLPILASCSVGTYGETQQGTDGSTGGDDRDLCVQRIATPAPAHNHAAAGANPAGTRAGTGCMAVGGCHGAQPGSVQFSIAGTAYTSLQATAPVGGVTVRLFMPGTKKSIAKAVTDDAGNFYLQTPVTFPPTGLEVDIAGCGTMPDIIPMVSLVRANEANCSSNNSCHLVPGPQPVYLPGG